MPEQITTAAELDSLPIGSVVMTETHRGFGGGYEQRVWMRHGGQGSPLIHDWQSTDGGFQRVGEPEHARGMWAVNRNVTVLYRPDAPPVIPGQNPGKPTAETVADALIRYETGGCCGFGTTCGLCDCGRSTDDAATRWLRNYHGSIDSTALLLAFRAGQKAAQPDGESSWIGDHKRLRELVAEDRAIAAKQLPVIVAAVLKPIRELHADGDLVCARHVPAFCPCAEVVCEACAEPMPCPTVRLLDEIEASAKGGDE